MRHHAVFLILTLFTARLGAAEVTLTVLATTDLHGNIYPHDYLTGRPSMRGLAALASVIKAERKSAPSALLVDCGDTIQGSQLESVYQSFVSTGKLPGKSPTSPTGLTMDPMMAAMNLLRYDAMAVGNHEYNYGWKNFDRARNEANFPWLSANTKVVPGSGRKSLQPFIIKNIDGVKVAIIGITTPLVPMWEKPENYRGVEFTDARAAAQAAVSELKSKVKPDVVLIISHSGVGAEPAKSGLGEDITQELATIPGVDAIIFGHTHSQLASLRIGNVLLTQPKNWGMSLSRIDLKLTPKPEGGFRVVSKDARIIPLTSSTEPDPELLKVAAPYHEITERYLETKITQVEAELSGLTSRVEDSAVIDAIHRAQMHYAKADVSFASSFNPRASIPKGPVTVRQLAALYLYDNELYVIDGTGQMVKEALENAARYFTGCQNAACSNNPLINREVIGYNFDIASGVTYVIDLTRPVGDRIQNLQFQGKPLEPTRKLRIALNNYRAGGSSGYTMFRGAKILWRSYEDIREMMLRYYATHPLPVAPDNNWRVVPDSARAALRSEAAREVPVLK